MLDRWQEPPCSWAVHIHKADRSFEGNWLSGQLPSIIGAALEYTVLWFDRRNSKLSRLSRSALREAASGRSSSGISDMSATSRQRHYQLRRKGAGSCHDCSRPVLNDGAFCEVHRRKRNLRNREWRRKFKRKTRNKFSRTRRQVIAAPSRRSRPHPP